MTTNETTTGNPNEWQVQAYLNAMYSHCSDWTTLKADGLAL